MPPSNLFFQIGCFFTGSRTTSPPSADTRTLTGSVVRPIRTFGPDGAMRTGPDGVAVRTGPCAGVGAAARPETAKFPEPIADARTNSAAMRLECVIRAESLACRRASSARLPPAACTAEPEELGPQRRTRSKRAAVGGRDDARPPLAGPADRHAQVLRLHPAGGPERAERP